MIVKYVNYIPRNVCNRNQEKQALQGHTIFLTDSDHNYSIEEFEHRNEIEYERKININVDKG